MHWDLAPKTGDSSQPITTEQTVGKWKSEERCLSGYCCALGTKCLLVYDISRHLPAETLPQKPAGPDGATLSLSPSRKTISEAGSTAFALGGAARHGDV